MAENYQSQLDDLLTTGVQKGASDIHLSPGYYPTLRIDGALVPLSDQKILSKTDIEGMVAALLGKDRKARFEKTLEADFSYQLGQDLRFRVNIYETRGNQAAVLRYVSNEIRSIADLHLPDQIKIFTKLSQGFVLVAGPTGHGKSTTCAAIIQAINMERTEKIITIEDPIEYIFNPERSIIDQREVGSDTLTFAGALRSTFRENANVIMVGELRDYDTISAAVTAAETGHLVLGSIHTNDAAQTIERIIDIFPPNQQRQIVSQLANSLSGVISQRLIPGMRGGLIPAVEVMIASTAVRNLIRESKIEQLNLAIETGAQAGMISLNQSLALLVRNKLISLEQAKFYSPNITSLQTLLK
ncbi:MAG: PilT/PilU family type 4a pilus ATPase [Patescibacteria group bacterium]